MKLDIRYTDHFPSYAKYFGRALRLLNSMYGMTNFGKLFADELTEWLLEAGFIQSKCKMYIYYKYAPDGSKQCVLSYVDYCVYYIQTGGVKSVTALRSDRKSVVRP